MEVGSKGLAEVNLTIPQGCSLDFEVKHTDDEGHPVDHTSSIIKMAFQSKDGGTTIDLSSCCTGTATGITVIIPASESERMALGKMLWDLIAETTAGDTIRIAYGSATIIDTYALDEA